MFSISAKLIIFDSKDNKRNHKTNKIARFNPNLQCIKMLCKGLKRVSARHDSQKLDTVCIACF